MRSRGGSTTVRSRTTTKTDAKTDADPPPDIPEVTCLKHRKKCRRFVAGAHTKNAGRAFYTCALGKDNPDRCNYFKWEDELHLSPTITRIAPTQGQTLGSSSAAPSIGQTLGQSPSSRFGGRKPPSGFEVPTLSLGVPPLRAGPGAGHALGPGESTDSIISVFDDEDDELDQSTDKGEGGGTDPSTNKAKEPLFTTPPSTQKQRDQTESASTSRTNRSGSAAHTPRSVTEGPLKDIAAKLRAASARAKRVRGDDETGEESGEPTPKRLAVDTSNPFVSPEPTTAPRTPTTRTADPSTSPTPRIAAHARTPDTGASSATSSLLSPGTRLHPALSPALAGLEEVNEELQRKDRLLHAAETMKNGFRTTIKNLQEKNKELEDKNKELEDKNKELEERNKVLMEKVKQLEKDKEA